jgi:adenylate kinase family enzyme
MSRPSLELDRVFRSWAEKKATHVVELIKSYPNGSDVWWASIVSALVEARIDGMQMKNMSAAFPKIHDKLKELNRLIEDAMRPDKS